jgi:hypothetical protein
MKSRADITQALRAVGVRDDVAEKAAEAAVKQLKKRGYSRAFATPC